MNAPDHPPKGRKDHLGGIPNKDGALARLGLRSPGLQTVFLNAAWASTSALAGSLPTGRGFRPSAFKHCCTGVGWRAIPRELRDLGDGFPHRRRGMLPKVRFEGGTRGGQLALRPLVVALLPLRETASHLGLEGAMDARLRHATQPQNRLNGSPLTAPGEGLQAYLHPRVRRLQPPIPQRFEVLGAQMERAPGQGLLLGWSVPSSGRLAPKTLQTSLSEARAEYITHKEQNRIAALPVEAVTAPITEAQFGRVEASLKGAPPVKFDVACQVRVFEFICNMSS